MQVLFESGKIKDAEITEANLMLKEKKLKEKGIDLNKIKLHANGKQYYIHLGAKFARENDVKEMFIASSKDALIEDLYETLFNRHSLILNDIFDKQYQKWRVEVGTASKTVKEDKCEYNRFFRDSIIGNKNVNQITVPDVRDVFLKMTSEHAISKTRFTSARSVLSGLLQYCCDKEFIQFNPVTQVNYSQFKKRFKPTEKKKDYTREEVIAICNHLKPSDNIYDYAIRFAFNLCARIGEVKSIKYSDINGNTLQIRRSTALLREAYVDDDNTVKFKDVRQVETVIKGAADAGFRDFPLTDEALRIAEAVHSASPENEYLFMHEGRQLCSDTFNRHLQKACKELGIEYRSSHVIRFTNCDALYHEADISRRDMQSFMGHTTAAMTDHYLNNRRASSESFEKAREFLNVVGN